MGEVTIKVRENGPYLVQGPFLLTDHEGNPIDPPPGKGVVLCRCGGSTTKPFCDGTHSKIGFDGARAAVEQSGP
jgi:CDGSH-type Zn-finger protein